MQEERVDSLTSAQAPPLGGAIFMHLLNCAMTASVTQIKPLITHDRIRNHVLKFMEANPQGVRNSEVGRAIGYNDSRQWFSYGILDKMINEGLVEKHDKLYFKA